jgi:hypothetical protein
VVIRQHDAYFRHSFLPSQAATYQPSYYKPVLQH